MNHHTVRTVSAGKKNCDQANISDTFVAFPRWCGQARACRLRKPVWPKPLLTDLWVMFYLKQADLEHAPFQLYSKLPEDRRLRRMQSWPSLRLSDSLQPASTETAPRRCFVGTMRRHFGGAEVGSPVKKMAGGKVAFWGGDRLY